MGYYAASSGNRLPTFRDNLSVPSSRVKKSYVDATKEMIPARGFECLSVDYRRDYKTATGRHDGYFYRYAENKNIKHFE